MYRFIKYMSLSLSLLMTVSSVHASGGGGGGFGGGGGYSGGGGGSYKPRVVDTNYERGKALYKGRSGSYGKISWCIDTPEGKKKLSKSHLSVHTTLSSLAAALYDCGEKNQAVQSFVTENDYAFMLYYLVKRYRLKLDTSA